MPVTIHNAMVKYSSSRTAKYNYSMKSITTKLDRLGWTWKVEAPATMILQFQKTFATVEEAVQGKKELTRALYPVGFRQDKVTHHE